MPLFIFRGVPMLHIHCLHKMRLVSSIQPSVPVGTTDCSTKMYLACVWYSSISVSAKLLVFLCLAEPNNPRLSLVHPLFCAVWIHFQPHSLFHLPWLPLPVWVVFSPYSTFYSFALSLTRHFYSNLENCTNSVFGFFFVPYQVVWTFNTAG